MVLHQFGCNGGFMDKEELINSFIEDIIFYRDYTSVKNSFLNDNYDSKKSHKTLLKITKKAQKLYENFYNDFVNLLDHNNLKVSSKVAEYLYPLFPKKCISILEKYISTLDEKLDIMPIKQEIEGFKKSQKFFVDEFKKFYKTDDIASLNKETK